MTPYATLLVTPRDTDEMIRRVYHSEARGCHPDMWGELHREKFETVTEAYRLINTAEKREMWRNILINTARLCLECAGFGVKGTRSAGGKVRICATCKGEGKMGRGAHSL